MLKYVRKTHVRKQQQHLPEVRGGGKVFSITPGPGGDLHAFFVYS